MDKLTFSLIVGVIAGIIVIFPMIARKMPASACISAFLQYLFLAVIILYIDLPRLPWWTEGGVICFAMALPVVLVVSGKDRKAAPVILFNALFIGTLISLAGHYIRIVG